VAMEPDVPVSATGGSGCEQARSGLQAHIDSSGAKRSAALSGGWCVRAAAAVGCDAACASCHSSMPLQPAQQPPPLLAPDCAEAPTLISPALFGLLLLQTPERPGAAEHVRTGHKGAGYHLQAAHPLHHPPLGAADQQHSICRLASSHAASCQLTPHTSSRG
jgi:hypothetical protein